MSKRFSLFVIFLLLCLTSCQVTYAQTQWLGVTDNWNSAANWTAGDPDPGETATFTNVGITNINITAPPGTAGQLDFTNVANTYTFNIGNGRVLTINGIGITNNSAAIQIFNLNGNGSQLTFSNNATVSGGVLTRINNFAGNGAVNFNVNSSAGNSTIVNNGRLNFNTNSNAGTATILDQHEGTLFRI